MLSTVIPSFILGVVLAVPTGFLTIPLWGAMRCASPKFASLKTLGMWTLLVAIFAFLFTGLYWPAYGVVAFIGGNVLATACVFWYVWRRMPNRVRARSRRQ